MRKHNLAFVRNLWPHTNTLRRGRVLQNENSRTAKNQKVGNETKPTTDRSCVQLDSCWVSVFNWGDLDKYC